jgi:hypothetical protein
MLSSTDSELLFSFKAHIAMEIEVGEPGQEFGAIADFPFRENPLYQTPAFTPTPRRGPEFQHGNPAWSPGPSPAVEQETGPDPAASWPMQGTVASSRGLPEDQEFAQILAALMHGELGPAEAVREFAIVCRQQAAAHR